MRTLYNAAEIMALEIYEGQVPYIQLPIEDFSSKYPNLKEIVGYLAVQSNADFEMLCVGDYSKIARHLARTRAPASTNEFLEELYTVINQGRNLR